MQVVYMGPVELPEKNHPKKIKNKISFKHSDMKPEQSKQEGQKMGQIKNVFEGVIINFCLFT